MRAGMIAVSAAAMLGLGTSSVEASTSCKSQGAVDVFRMSQEEYEQFAGDAGEAACVTMRPVTLCQMVPMSTGTWVVVAEIAAGWPDAESIAQLQVTYEGSCLFNAYGGGETDSRWVEVVAEYEVPEEPRPLGFSAYVSFPTPSDTPTAVSTCPLGDGYDGTRCNPGP